MEYKKNKNISLVKLNENNGIEVYKYILDHFFITEDNLYISNSNNEISLTTYKNSFNNLTSFDNMVINNYPYLNSNAEENEIRLTFKNYEDYDAIPVFNNKELAYELQRLKQYHKIPINSERWFYLYKNNKKIVEALKKYKFDTLYVIGDLFDEFYNYIIINTDYKCLKLSNSRESLINKIDESNSLIIDTNYICSEFRKKIYELESYKRYGDCANYISLEELCESAELISFKEFYNNKHFHTLLFEFQVPEDLTNLTYHEQLRISFDRHYRYYYENINNPEINVIVKRVLGRDYSKEFILSRNDMSGTILKNGICYLADSDNPYCKASNGLRYTAYKDNMDFYSKINVFGSCIVYGAVVDDYNTIPSLLQKRLNNDDYKYEVFNYGARAIDFYDNYRTASSLKIKENDIFIFVVSPDERKKLESIGIKKIHKFAEVFNNDKKLKDYFMGEPVHCNAEANEAISNYIYNFLSKKLIKSDNLKDSKVVKHYSKHEANEEYMSSGLKDYLNYLKTIDRKTSLNGAVMINGNPFTYGHYHLIKYASSRVDTLYVFIVREDKSYFKYDDRLQMAINNCKELKNVVVTGSGTVFGTAMTFPSYYQRDSKQEVRLDASLDVELFSEYVAPTLNITKRFVGDEPNDYITNQYNMLLKEKLGDYGIDLTIIPRYEKEGRIISAKSVRNAIEKNDKKTVKELVPFETYLIIEKKYMKKES